MTHKRILTPLVLGASLVGLGMLSGCEKGGAEKVGEKIDKAADKTGDAVKDAANKVEDKLDKDK